MAVVGYGDSGAAAGPEIATPRVRKAPRGKFWKAARVSPGLCRERRACRAPYMGLLGDAAVVVAREAPIELAQALSARDAGET
jgi:hypothetical protein